MMRRRRPLSVLALVLVQVLVLGTAAVSGAARWVSMPLAGDDPYVLLVMGSDQGPYRSGTVWTGRADTLQLVVVDSTRQFVSIVSFPRDSWVPVRGRGNDRINTLLLPGTDAAVGTIQDLTGLTVNDWIVTTFSGFLSGVDAVGGVNINVEQRLTHTGTGSGANGVVLNPGQQLLEGRQALGYTRDRKSRPGGDVGRATAGATMLRALHRDFRERVTSPLELAEYAGALRAHTASSISTSQLLRLASVAANIDPGNVEQVTLPVRVGTAIFGARHSP